jgi:ornithine decarboxylase
MGEKAGFHFTLLDIGGGFPGQSDAKISFEEICGVLRPALDMYFPESSGVRIIAEPGRFFVASAFTLAVNIIAKRRVAGNSKAENDGVPDQNEEPSFMYYVNDGVYGSFNCLLYDHAEVKANLLDDHSGEPFYSSSVWGPTCDGLDCILPSCLLPELYNGEWVLFKDMGAYTMCAASNFNGMPKPRCYYMAQEYSWDQLGSIGFGRKKQLLATSLPGYQPLGSASLEPVDPDLHTLLRDHLAISPEI